MTTTEVSTSTTTSLADAGLLILRIGVGATMIQAGLRKAFDFDTTVGFMESGGWRPGRSTSPRRPSGRNRSTCRF